MEFHSGKVTHETQYFAEPLTRRVGEANGFNVSRDAALRRGGIRAAVELLPTFMMAC